MIIEGLHATRQHLGTTILYSLHLNIFNYHEIPLAGKLSNVDSENLENFFTLATRCWALKCETDLRPAVVWYLLLSRFACTNHEIPLAGKLSNVDSENLENFFTEVTRCWAVYCDTGFKTSSGMVPFVWQARMYKL